MQFLKLILKYGEDHPQYASTLTNLSNAMRNLGDYEGAK
jgi:hypothetical protein